jgi:hypothetical protein
MAAEYFAVLLERARTPTGEDLRTLTDRIEASRPARRAVRHGVPSASPGPAARRFWRRARR